jgi:circadian clock protein KaiC
VLHTIIGKVTHASGLTSIVISEIPIGSSALGAGMEEFVADGVMTLSQSSEKGQMVRRLQVIKMRGTETDTKQLRYEIGKNGIKVYSALKFKLIEKPYTQRVKTGIVGLDKMLEGGVYKGSLTLIAGGAGTGKTTAALTFIVEGAKNGEKGLFISTEEQAQQLIRAGELFGWHMNELVGSGALTIVHIDPEEHALLQAGNLLRDLKPARFVIDGLGAIERIMAEDEFLRYLRGLESNAKASAVASLWTIQSESITPLLDTSASTIVDTIIAVRHVEIDSELRRSLVILKARGMAHDREIREFEINSEGIQIKERFNGVVYIPAGSPRQP